MPDHPVGAITKIVIFGIISRLRDDTELKSQAIFFRQYSRPSYELDSEGIAWRVLPQQHYRPRLVPSPDVRVEAEAVRRQIPQGVRFW